MSKTAVCNRGSPRLPPGFCLPTRTLSSPFVQTLSPLHPRFPAFHVAAFGGKRLALRLAGPLQGLFGAATDYIRVAAPGKRENSVTGFSAKDRVFQRILTATPSGKFSGFGSATEDQIRPLCPDARCLKKHLSAFPRRLPAARYQRCARSPQRFQPPSGFIGAFASFSKSPPLGKPISHTAPFFSPPPPKMNTRSQNVSPSPQNEPLPMNASSNTSDTSDSLPQLRTIRCTSDISDTSDTICSKMKHALARRRSRPVLTN